ncbi:MAG: glycosyltransferase, partial [Marmoricola sp.]|nr:glycosyltransferase [Marmoricola sp.]
MAEVTAVVTCMTDGERPWVREALDSVARQTRPTAAIVCVADSNTWIDDTVRGLDADISVLRLPMAPSGEVRNAGVQAARTELVAFLDGDDAWVPTKVDRQVTLLRQHSLDLIASKHVMIRDDGVPFFYAFADRMPMTSSWLGRRELFVGTPFSSLLVGQDVEL